MSPRAFASVFLLALVLSPGLARGDLDVISHVDVGFSGRYKAGLWTPVRVHLAEGADVAGAELSLIVSDGDGVPSRVATRLPSPAPSSALLYVRFGRIDCPLTVRVQRDGKTLAEREFRVSDTPSEKTIPPALLSDQRLVVEVGTESLGIADAIVQMREADDERTTLATLADATELPDKWYGYEGVETVVLSGTDPACYAGLAPNDVRILELAKWVRRGGRVLITIGEHADELLAADGPLNLLLPGKFAKTVPLSQAHSLEVFSQSQVRLPMRSGKRSLRVAQLTDVEGYVAAAEGNLPLVVYQVRGFGQLVFFASDLDRGPIGAWKARPQFVAALFGWPTKLVEDDDNNRAISHFGFADLAGQLRSALDQFEGVWQIPFSLIVAAIVLYLLLIGPGDWFLLRKVVGRMQLTWITFPALVLLFCVGAYYVAHRTKGDQFLVNQAAVIDVDVESGELRGTAWANVFSPQTRRLDVRFSLQDTENGTEDDWDQLTAWFGLPGRALGGMASATPLPTVWSKPYDFAEDRSWLRDVPIQVWSSKSLTTRWSGKVTTSIECELEQDGPIPAGRLTSRLAVPLSDCLLVYGDWVYELGTLSPGQRFRVGPLVPRRELTSFLTGRKLVFDKEEARARQQVTRYDIESTDPAYALGAMTFFKAAGGRPYTHLANSYQGFVDMSDLLQTDRAVLVGKPPTDAALPGSVTVELSSDGQELPAKRETATLLRFLLPVTPEGS